MDIVFASANQNKVREIAAMLPPRFQLLGLKEVGINEEIPELGTTIKENSFLKASYVLDVLQRQGRGDLPVFADDSGLEVEALAGSPGVNSAYYAGPTKDDAANCKKLAEALQSSSNRQARFVTVITLLLNDLVHYFDGAVAGTITSEARGQKGFGYDPLFIPAGYSSTFAELSAEVKNSISHRAKAVRQLVEFLKREEDSAVS